MPKFMTVLKVCSMLGALFVIVIAPEFFHLRPGQAGFVAEFRRVAIIGLAVLWSPVAVYGAALTGRTLHRRLRKPDFIITVTERPTPLGVKFQEQDRRLERRERLKGELFALNAEIETFNAGMDFDARKAWANRPGPYGK